MTTTIALQSFHDAYLNLDEGIGKIMAQSRTIPEDYRATWIQNRINDLREQISDQVKSKEKADQQFREIFGCEPPREHKTLEDLKPAIEEQKKRYHFLVRTFEEVEIPGQNYSL